MLPLPLRELLKPILPAHGHALPQVELITHLDQAGRASLHEPRVLLAVQGALVVQPLAEARGAGDLPCPVGIVPFLELDEALVPRFGFGFGTVHRPQEAYGFEEADSFGREVPLLGWMIGIAAVVGGGIVVVGLLFLLCGLGRIRLVKLHGFVPSLVAVLVLGPIDIVLVVRLLLAPESGDPPSQLHILLVLHGNVGMAVHLPVRQELAVHDLEVERLPVRVLLSFGLGFGLDPLLDLLLE
mmetsp:Transcript_33745/g.81586  ORF Transcript_33745/g.81586 Transcript_33745/m.81586 type:complete len:241 (+) Transcript_33745:949-1671(+)